MALIGVFKSPQQEMASRTAYANHEQKLRKISGKIDNKPPIGLSRSPIRQRGLQDYKSYCRKTEIEQENVRIIKNLISIKSNKKTKSRRKRRRHSNIPKPNSLNITNRRNDAIKINEENYRIMQRLNNMKSTFNNPYYNTAQAWQDKRLSNIQNWTHSVRRLATRNVRSPGGSRAGSPTGTLDKRRASQTRPKSADTAGRRRKQTRKSLYGSNEKFYDDDF